MKTLKLILAIVLVSLTTTSCDDYLDVENYNGIPADDLVNSVENAQTAINGVYNGLYGDGSTSTAIITIPALQPASSTSGQALRMFARW